MYLVQIFLPVRDNHGRRIARQHFEALAQLLSERFGGLTRYSRAPAAGLWKGSGRRTQRDDIVVYEVMVRSLQRRWWKDQRRRLERTFRQEEILIRAHAITRL